MNKVLFVINDGIYPYHTGGMEIFNYHLIRTLSKDTSISYMASRCYDFDSALFIKSCSLKPTKVLSPLWLLLYLMFHRQYKKVVFSFSAAHWLVWRLYEVAIRTLKLEATIVIHYGKDVPSDHRDAYRKFFLSAKNVVAVSDDIKKNYDRAFGLVCRVIYPLIPFRFAPLTPEFYRTKYHIPQGSNVISMVGTLKEMKNPNRILESLLLFDNDELRQYKPHVVYAGTGPMMNDLQDFVESHGLSDYVSFLGVIPNDAVCEIMALTNIYLIASDFEGTSVSLLEAMFNAKPIVASDVPGLRDMIKSGYNGLLYDVSSAVSLKQSILALLLNVNKARKLGKAAKDSFEDRYDYSIMIEAYKEMLR